jgi:hypothetical protein
MLEIIMVSDQATLPPVRLTELLWYGVCFLLCCGSLFLGARLNPRDMVGGSWTDPYLQTISGLSFAFCVFAPLWSRRPWSQRVGLCFCSFGLLLIPFFIWYEATA